MKFNTAIIDMDPLVYRCGFSIEKFNKETNALDVEPVHHAFYNINSMMKKIINATGCEYFEGYLTSNDKSNFRFELFEDYKSNRKGARKPVYYNEIRDYLIKKYEAIVVSGQEADDMCSIRQMELNPLGFDNEIANSIVCSFDKDFNNIPGWHHNFIKDEIYYVDEKEALKNFYLQILTGDTADGIPRIRKGWKQKDAEKRIREAETEQAMIEVVWNEFSKLHEDDKELIVEKINLRGQLVWLRRKPEEMWKIPVNF